MILMFCDLHVSLNNPSSGDINSSNSSCSNHLEVISNFRGTCIMVIEHYAVKLSEVSNSNLCSIGLASRIRQLKRFGQSSQKAYM